MELALHRSILTNAAVGLDEAVGEREGRPSPMPKSKSHKKAPKPMNANDFSLVLPTEGRSLILRVFLTATATVLVLSQAVSLAAQGSAEDLERLYRAGQWFELRTLVTERSPALIRGAVATAFDPARAERLLRTVIRFPSASDAADEAYALLCRTYIMSGRYRRFVETYREWGVAFPGSRQFREQRDSVERFGGRPDQINGPARRATVRHESDAFTVPVSINGQTDDFLFDTGALHSVLTDREARKFGLTIGNDVKVLTGASGDTFNFRTAIAKTVTVGATSFHDVSFAVLDPTGPMRDAEVGVVGLPLLLGLRSIRWSNDGTAEIGGTSPHAKTGEPNLVFDRGRLLVRSEVLGHTALLALDTGAATTDLNANFAAQFATAVEGAKRATQNVTGVGGTRTFESIELPELALTIGPTRVYLRPAQITLQRIAAIGGECCIGNAGRDLLMQGRSFTIDLSTMTLRLQ
jgi:predicted aspartyl protease